MIPFVLTFPPGTSFGSFANTGSPFVGGSNGAGGTNPAQPGELTYELPSEQVGNVNYLVPWPNGVDAVQVTAAAGGGGGGGNGTAGTGSQYGAGGGGGGGYTRILIPQGAMVAAGHLRIELSPGSKYPGKGGTPGFAGEHGGGIYVTDDVTPFLSVNGGSGGGFGGKGAGGAGGEAGEVFPDPSVITLVSTNGSPGDAAVSKAGAGGTGGAAAIGSGGAGGEANAVGLAGTGIAGGGGAGANTAGGGEVGGNAGGTAWVRIKWPPDA